MSSTYGENLKLSIFGQSHGAAIGMTLDGIPAGLPVDTDALQIFLNRRARSERLVNAAKGSRPAGISLRNSGRLHLRRTHCRRHLQQKHPLRGLRQSEGLPRPGHADLTAQIKYGGFQDAAGGGHFSGRLTAALHCGRTVQTMAGGHGNSGFRPYCRHCGHFRHAFDPLAPDMDSIPPDFPVIKPDAGAQMRDAISAAKGDGDSVGGIVECAITGLPAGVGDPMFGSIEIGIPQIVYGVPAVKGVEFGAGFSAANLRGSQNNDDYVISDGQIRTVTNNAGGILGGITTGMPLIFRAALKPTPSISRPQQSVSLSSGEMQELVIKGRHDPCIVPRAVPVIEAAAAIAIFDMILGNTRTDRRKP
ncbi:MAG: chorismate synthase [Oscillospiraceae bacterium]